MFHGIVDVSVIDWDELSRDELDDFLSRDAAHESSDGVQFGATETTHFVDQVLFDKSVREG